jgi:hypothetical protein
MRPADAIPFEYQTVLCMLPSDPLSSALPQALTLTLTDGALLFLPRRVPCELLNSQIVVEVIGVSQMTFSKDRTVYGANAFVDNFVTMYVSRHVRFSRYRFKFQSNLVWDSIKSISNFCFQF